MGTVYMKQKGTHLTIHWGYHFEAPRSSGASSSCLLHPPSCNTIFGGEFHPDLQRPVNTEKARLLLEVDIYLGCFNWRQRRIDCLKSITLLSPQTALLRMLSDHTRIPPQTMNSSHMLLTRKLCWLIVIARLKRKSWGQHLLRSSMFWSSWLFRENAWPFSCQKLNKH